MSDKNDVTSTDFMDTGTALSITYEMSGMMYKMMTRATEKLYPDNKENAVCLSMNGTNYTYKDIKTAMNTVEDFITNNFGEN